MPEYPDGEIRIMRGEYYALGFQVTDSEGAQMVLTGYTPRAKMRSVSDPTQVYTIGTSIVADPETEDADREIRMEILSSESRAIPVGSYNLALELIPPTGEDYVDLLMTAVVVITPEVA